MKKTTGYCSLDQNELKSPSISFRFLSACLYVIFYNTINTFKTASPNPTKVLLNIRLMVGDFREKIFCLKSSKKGL